MNLSTCSRSCLATLWLAMLAPVIASPSFSRAEFVVPPEVFVRHTVDRAFGGPGTFQLKNGDIIMAAPWGRPPANFEELIRTFPVPRLYRSRDHGRTWTKEGALKLEWKL